jgi:hypothetical protein
LREQETRSADAYRLSEHFDKLTKAIWGEVGSATPGAIKSLDGPQTRRELQRAFVDRMATYVVEPPPGSPDDARALARLALTRVDSRCARTLAAARRSATTRGRTCSRRAPASSAQLAASRETDNAPPPARPGAVMIQMPR